MRGTIFPLILALFPLARIGCRHPAMRRPSPVHDGNGGLTLAPGFCAVVVAESLGPVRQITLGPDGAVYGALAKGDGGVVALRDTDGDGRADERRVFGPPGGNDVKIHDGYLYLALPDRIVRWRLVAAQLQPPGEPEIIVDGLPADASHKAKSIAFSGSDVMYVNIGAPTNSCQKKDRTKGSTGSIRAPNSPPAAASGSSPPPGPASGTPGARGSLPASATRPPWACDRAPASSMAPPMAVTS